MQQVHVAAAAAAAAATTATVDEPNWPDRLPARPLRWSIPKPALTTNRTGTRRGNCLCEPTSVLVRDRAAYLCAGAHTNTPVGRKRSSSEGVYVCLRRHMTRSAGQRSPKLRSSR